MHPASLQLMRQMVERIDRNVVDSVLDVGSLDVNGSYRDMIEARGWQYTGLDIRPGANVDVVARDPYSWPYDEAQFDMVISGSTMEHVEAVWLWVPELVRVLRPGGLLAIVTHWKYPEHRYPVDCWRFMPDGIRFLFDQTLALSDYEIGIANDTDITATAIKVK